MLFTYQYNHSRQKKNRRLPLFPAVLVSLVMAVSLLSGCSGTGTMYNPNAVEDDSDLSGTGASTAVMSSGSTASGAEAGSISEQAPGLRDHAGNNDHNDQNAAEPVSEEEPRTLRADLEGTGSDLYTRDSVSSYYSFTLDGESFSLPSSPADFQNAGWELSLSDTGAAGADSKSLTIPSFSFENVPAFSADKKRQISLCLANFTENDLDAASCTVCGITVSQSGGAVLKTTFNAGIGDSLNDLTAVFSTDPSVYTRNQYADGSCVVHYHFANGLYEGESIPVLAEAEEKSLAELLLAETDTDGSTIRSLSLYFFRLPQ
jgi:hypothetical protein